MNTIIKNILTDAGARDAKSIRSAAASSESFDPWGGEAQ